MKTYPNKIKILSDGNELEFKEFKIKQKIPMVEYVYTLSETKLGLVLPLTEVEFDKLLSRNIAEIIK